MGFRTLDLETLRTLIVAHDCGGFGEAASRLNRTPSAVSLQMKRLQESIGAPLFRKDGRGVALTDAGDITLRYARRMLALNDELLHTIQGASLTGSVRLGCSQDFAETVLPVVLARFAKLYPLVLVEVRIDGNSALVDALEKEQLDLALTVGQAERRTAQVLADIELVWIAAREFQPRSDQPLPLVLFGPQCAFRQEAISRLDDAGWRWRIAAVSPSLAGLWASALGGLGITVRSSLGLPKELTFDAQLFGLPALKRFPVTLHSCADRMIESVDRLRAIMLDVVGSVLTGNAQ
jgi:DNA-binding transcriptional LysR family regulator